MDVWLAEKSLCGWVAQQNRVTPSPFDLGLKTLDLDLDLDCDNMAAELLLVGGVERVAALKACCHSEGSCGWKRMINQ